MRRLLVMGLACLAMAGCSRAPDGGQMAADNVAAPGVAFTYAYTFRLPSADIAAVQERQAQACERLAPRCRITGMTYHVDGSGEVGASLATKLEAGIARRFGHASVEGVEQAGGTLADADIEGTDAAPAIETARRQNGDDAVDLAAIDRELARPDLKPVDRARLGERRAAIVTGVRDTAAMLAAAQASVATTPMQFTYRAGAGVGLGASLADAGHVAWSSLVTTLSTALTLVAAVGPPAVLLGLLVLLWRLARRWWWRWRWRGEPAA